MSITFEFFMEAMKWRRATYFVAFSFSVMHATATQPKRDPVDTLSLINGFPAFIEWQFEVTPESEEIKKQKRILEYKRQLARNVIEPLRQSTDPTVLALSDRIEFCNATDNLYVASDLHNEDGECFTGKGTLWSCNSRLCPNCVGKLARRNRKTIRFVVENEKLFLGEDWLFITFTVPNLLLADFELPDVADLMQTAWERFTHQESKAKAKTWFQKHIRGGFKNCEFTFTRNDVFNYHIHSLCVGRKRIKHNNFVEIRGQWTRALRFAFAKHGIEFQCNTADGFAVVNVQKADAKTVDRELCKYVTKNDSWVKLPIEQLEKLAVIPRFSRMFEAFGVCRQTAREMRKTATNEQANLCSEADKSTNLDTEKLIRRQQDETSGIFPPQPKPRRVSWRKRSQQIPRWMLKIELQEEIEQTASFRQRQLRFRYPAAEFQTLGGKTF